MPNKTLVHFSMVALLVTMLTIKRARGNNTEAIAKVRLFFMILM